MYRNFLNYCYFEKSNRVHLLKKRVDSIYVVITLHTRIHRLTVVS